MAFGIVCAEDYQMFSEWKPKSANIGDKQSPRNPISDRPMQRRSDENPHWVKPIRHNQKPFCDNALPVLCMCCALPVLCCANRKQHAIELSPTKRQIEQENLINAH